MIKQQINQKTKCASLAIRRPRRGLTKLRWDVSINTKAKPINVKIVFYAAKILFLIRNSLGLNSLSKTLTKSFFRIALRFSTLSGATATS